MKIIRLSTFLDFGGVETRLSNISHIRDENEWAFVCLNNEGKAAEVIKGNGKRIINLQSKPTIYSLRTFFRTYKVLKKERPDVLHTSGAEANFHGILAAKLAGVPVIIGEEIGIPSHSRKGRFIFSIIYKLARYIIGNSDMVLERVNEINNVPKEKLKKIENPIIFKELPKHHENEHVSNEFRMITISRLEPVKNIEGLINVLDRLVNESVSKLKLTIAGSGNSEMLIKEKVESLNLGDYIDFVGYVNDPYPHLLNSDLYILNSFSEGFSNSLVEAMYSKTPSLSTAVGAAPEIIEEGVNGFLIPPDNEQALYEKIKSIISLEEEKLKEIGQAGYETIVQNFSLEKHLEKLMAIYK